MWGIRARVRAKTGPQYQTTPFLWRSKSEAEDDVGLFVWYRSVKDSSDPLIPTPVGQWFKSMLPNSDWDIVRDHLDNRVEKKIYGLKRKVGQIGVAISSQIAKRKMEKNKVKVEDIPPEVEMVEDEQLIREDGWKHGCRCRCRFN
jgi:(2Fe-2S) ferredoxin